MPISGEWKKNVKSMNPISSQKLLAYKPRLLNIIEGVIKLQRLHGNIPESPAPSFTEITGKFIQKNISLPLEDANHFEEFERELANSPDLENDIVRILLDHIGFLKIYFL